LRTWAQFEYSKKLEWCEKVVADKYCRLSQDGLIILNMQSLKVMLESRRSQLEIVYVTSAQAEKLPNE